MKEIIYLIGQISVDKDITYQWRRDVRDFFKDKFNLFEPQMHNNFEIIDPCDNEWNKAVKEQNGDHKDPQRLKIYKSKGIGLIVPKDHSYVLRSTGCIANMNQYDKDKPVIGTMFELAWYYQNPEKCVIGVFNGDPENDLHCNHPFVKETVDVWCRHHMEAAQLLSDYYNRGVN
jgi:hypothetical protein